MTKYELRALIACVDAGICVGIIYPDEKDDLIDTLKSAYATIHTAKERESKLINAMQSVKSPYGFILSRDEYLSIYKKAGLKELE
jgi:hypothetical protein